MEGVTQLEDEVMLRLLDGEDPVLAALREQYRNGRVSGRELTGVGFFTTFEVPSFVRRVTTRPSACFGDVQAQLEGISHGAGFLLWLKDGALGTLEGYTFDEPWPHDVRQFVVTYTGGGRDLASIRSDILGKG